MHTAPTRQAPRLLCIDTYTGRVLRFVGRKPSGEARIRHQYSELVRDLDEYRRNGAAPNANTAA